MKLIKVNNLVENLFAQAVALDQSGGLKNTIYAMNREIFILNFDHTMFLRFRLRDSDSLEFSQPISFRANDYDSNEFYEEDGNIIFVTRLGGVEKKKICKAPEISPEKIQTLFKEYLGKKDNTVTITLSKDYLTLLDRDLSHIEFSGKKGESMKLLQRNIYSGGIIEITEEQNGLFTQALPFDIEPIALRTNDFVALFTFQDSLKFTFNEPGSGDFVVVKSLNNDKFNFVAIVACCIYDEIIEIKKSLKS